LRRGPRHSWIIIGLCGATLLFEGSGPRTSHASRPITVGPELTGADVGGPYASIAFDAQGPAHVSYYDEANGDLRYARRAGATWTSERVDGASDDVGYDTSIAIDSLGNPCISYYDATHGSLKFAHRSGGIWIVEVADSSSEDTGAYTSLALDGTGNPCISYYDYAAGDLRYARKSGGSWTCETVDDADEDTGLYSSLALDAHGNPHISFYDASNGNLKYAWRSDEAWNVVNVDASPDDVGLDTSITLDPMGRPHISYDDAAAGKPLDASMKAEGWTISPVTTSLDDPGHQGAIGEAGPVEGASTPAGVGFAVYPNPSRGEAVHIQLGAGRAERSIAVDILDAGGRRLRRMQPDAAGGLLWDGRDERQRPVPPGVYFARVITADGKAPASRRLVVVP